MLTMIGERDLLPSGDITAALELERRHAAADYDSVQGELGTLSPQRDGDKITELKMRLIDLRVKREDVERRIKNASPRYASLRYPQPLDETGTRTALDAGALLLSYSVGINDSHLFAVEPLGTKGMGLWVFTLAATEKSLREAVEAYRSLMDWRGPSGDNSAQDLRVQSRALYDILIKPAQSLIAKYDRVLILPDGPLHTLPFGALVCGIEDGEPRYLVEWKPIHTAVSATVYTELKKARRQSQSSAIEVAGFGDPKYPKPPDKKLVAVRRGEGEEAAETTPQ